MANKDFNKAEALRRYKAGEKVTAIAEAMGVKKTDVYSAIRELKRAEEWNGIGQPAANADGDKGAGKVITAPEDKKTSESAPVADTGAEKDVPKKRGRKKKAEEPAADTPKAEIADGEAPEDIEDHADSIEDWAARKIGECNPPRDYLVKLKDGSELTVKGVYEVIDRFTKVAFVGKSGKAVIVTAAELVYYCVKSDIDTFGEISVD